MKIDTWILLTAAAGQWAIVLLIYWELEGQRLDRFLEDAALKNSDRKALFEAYCGITDTAGVPRNERLRQMLNEPEQVALRDICDENIRLFSRVGARLPIFPPLRRQALNWHVVVLLWEIVGPYVLERRRAAGPSFAKTFLTYAKASTNRLLKQHRDEWVIIDSNRKRKQDVTITRTRLMQILEELDTGLSAS